MQKAVGALAFFSIQCVAVTKRESSLGYSIIIMFQKKYKTSLKTKKIINAKVILE